jgi:hypothetical protein
MGNIRSTRDTFLHFIADNSITTHAVRFDAADPSSNVLQVGAVNVTFHDVVYETNCPTKQFVTLDILHASELSALDLEEQLVVLLTQAGYTPLLDYSGESPVPVSNTLIYWDPTSIKFRTVAAADYFHRSAILQLLIRYV